MRIGQLKIRRSHYLCPTSIQRIFLGGRLNGRMRQEAARKACQVGRFYGRLDVAMLRNGLHAFLYIRVDALVADVEIAGVEQVGPHVLDVVPADGVVKNGPQVFFSEF